MLTFYIPVKASSSRIPRKSLSAFSDYTLLTWTLDKIRRSYGSDARTVIATRDTEISHIALRWGCEIFWLTSDEAEAELAIYALTRFLREKKPYPTIATHVTSPFTLKTEFDRGLRKANPVAVSGYSYYPSHQGNVLVSSKETPLKDQFTGNFVAVTSPECLEMSLEDWFTYETMFPVSFLSRLDINDPEDLEEAQRLVKQFSIDFFVDN